MPSGSPLPLSLPSRWPRLAAAVLLAVGLFALALLGVAGAGPAAAHDVLIGTDPADGAVVTTPPTAVELTFAQQALKIGTRLRVTGPGGTVVSSRPVQVVGSYVTQPLDPGLAPGGYTVVWRVTSADGHPVSGSFGFTVAGATGAVQASAAAAPQQPGSVSAARIAVIGAAGLGVVLLGAIAMILLVRRPGRSTPPQS